MRFTRVFPLLVLLFVTNASAQTIAPSVTSDPQALALAQQAVLALTNGAATADAVLTGTATRIIGGDEQTGTVSLKLKGTTESRIDLSLSNTFGEVRNDSSGQSFWLGSDQTWQPMALHNSMTDAAWFFPALSSLAQVGNPSVLFTYVGQETIGGTAVHHVRVSRPQKDRLLTRLSTMDFYLDAKSLLPLGVSFDVHPDNDAGRDIPAEIGFGDYRSVNGLRVPYRIQKQVQGSLLLDLTITNVAINVGLQDSDFSVR